MAPLPTATDALDPWPSPSPDETHQGLEIEAVSWDFLVAAAGEVPLATRRFLTTTREDYDGEEVYGLDTHEDSKSRFESEWLASDLYSSGHYQAVYAVENRRGDLILMQWGPALGGGWPGRLWPVRRGFAPSRAPRGRVSTLSS